MKNKEEFEVKFLLVFWTVATVFDCFYIAWSVWGVIFALIACYAISQVEANWQRYKNLPS